jgi:hypothetical protein
MDPAFHSYMSEIISTVQTWSEITATNSGQLRMQLHIAENRRPSRRFERERETLVFHKRH